MILTIMAAHISPPGLTYTDDFITKEEETALLTAINGCPWDTTLARRTQHYGYKYPYQAKDKLEVTTAIPQFCEAIQKRAEELTNKQFDQLIINEYVPGQGISAHVDNIKLFGDTVVSVTLGSFAAMVFTRHDEDNNLVTYEKVLKRRSIAILQGDSRYKWTHSIPARKQDNGHNRSTRISLTFRIKK